MQKTIKKIINRKKRVIKFCSVTMEEQIFTTFGTSDRQILKSNGEESPFLSKTEQQNEKGRYYYDLLSYLFVDVDISQV